MSTYEVVVVRYGTRRTVRSEVFLNYSLYGEPDAPIGMDYFFWIVRDEQRTFVVDTGFSRAGGANRARTTLIEPVEAFRALGVDAADAPTVIVTHAHYDHIGNLDHFDRSPVVVARSEVDFWAGPHSRRTQFHHSVEDAELAELAAVVDSGRAVLFDERITVADGIEVIRVGGHTPGQSVVRVATADGPVLLASDALHYYEESEKAMPFVSVADLVEMYDGFDTIDAMSASGAVAHVVSGHDPVTLDRFGRDGGPLGDATAVIGGTRGARA
ncbi:N-acyl homoserine lactonase family protein [Actinacidiphila acididurans]|uniref:N-acyl homoserine lactonase family protein n=1 Tax=Actinacidiphila acididurans TaxID=2784346 RepID=UPI0027DE6717|nr:N-acyl homoserine lactonase family protein [Actinacidiphila acididurans]